MNTETLIQKLELNWDSNGFLDSVRRGNFDSIAGQAFLDLLKGISIPDDELVPKRLLSLLWYLPSFLEWQKERIEEVSGRQTEYGHFVTEVQNVLEAVLGVP